MMIVLLCFLLSSTTAFIVEDHVSKKDLNLTKLWALKLHISDQETYEHLHAKADQVAFDLQMKNLGPIGNLAGHYLFASKNFTQNITHTIGKHTAIKHHEKQHLLTRVKRDLESLSFTDPAFDKQWHLSNDRGLDCNVTGVWGHGVHGDGVVVAIVDDGVEWRNPDLKENYCAEGSFDLNDGDDDPTPKKDKKSENKHGTRCAGEVSAIPNSVCGVGIAFKSKFSGIRILDGLLTDSTEATAFTKKLHVNDIYSCSWGPEDDGKTVDGPHWLARSALEHGVLAGRKGFGSIYFVASGNGGLKKDNCNYDGYAASIYTITIAAVDEFGRKPSYAEPCASMMTSTVSSGSYPSRPITTTDWSYDGDQCTNTFTGTSAATPLASGMIALMLQVRPCLSWRDVKHIIAMTSSHTMVNKPSTIRANFFKNAAGFTHNDYHGFGFMDAWRLVNAARVWELVPWMTSYKSNCNGDNSPIPIDESLELTCNVSKSNSEKYMLHTIEHVVVIVNVKHENRGKLKFVIECPSGTKSVIGNRLNDKSSDGLKDWEFMTVKCWGENPVGTFKFSVIDTRNNKKKLKNFVEGKLLSWKLVVYGSQMTTGQLNSRWAAVESSYSGELLNGSMNSLSCPAGQEVSFDLSEMLSERTIKLIALMSGFFLFWSVYNIIESIWFSREDKINIDNVQASNQHNTNGYNTMTDLSPNHNSTEQIQMTNLRPTTDSTEIS